ncbi:2-oxoisovalerate dehydrogenase [candidate division WOR-1 bacterium RIFOXYB2_FULL_42_35]|uniref:2-oxoisovalerate dehydrogenase n=1 Tax=candidate division WOR-1 bacterium RIFOXYC2_FULL_41_25 TaxID=1802586 RepID=A0A1F4TRD6_UNCSA|nr:MAG: 2-oxoisovalerate dehydrogenase [candidate division WOR-1 bacterium RIFOXYB2_FULL_42_35]OGC24568.1 MAG: 2-oxoisovalerate dehydrogenase [candidate division WOR-1 bacterium RIFOXYA2_FULL_41_14]OGC34613.1 MAG: 2-oxoisovalerate dehydrogenase [candidate division WOR-1 bacterium RIFOXYC2_FULL_41_25]OGC43979.1 MAG: 2-oxoisovalerate dehydrogenase [candidate division WOR-1 bacterium RIFOXYD2_FULL_41_8]
MVKTEIIFMVEEDLSGGYSAKALGQSIFTEADNLPELKDNIKKALACHFEKKEDIPSVVILHIVREETLTYA